MIETMLACGELYRLAGFYNDRSDGAGCNFNFIVYNDSRSTRRYEEKPAYYTFMLPKDAPNKIRAVIIHYGYFINGFRFFDKDGALVFKTGETTN